MALRHGLLIVAVGRFLGRRRDLPEPGGRWRCGMNEFGGPRKIE